MLFVTGMKKFILVAALLLSSGSAFAAPKGSSGPGAKPLVDYTEKNRRYFARLDRQQQRTDPSGWAQTLRDRAANARSANPAWVAPALGVAGAWWQGAMFVGMTVNPIGTERALQMLLNANAYRRPF